MRARLTAAILIAAGLWFLMFSPLTSGLAGFWAEMTFSAIALTLMAVFFGRASGVGMPAMRRPLLQAVVGVAIAFALWGVFVAGDRLSQMMFGFARGQVDMVYSLRTGMPEWAIAVLLLLVIGPAEEFFWRGYVQAAFAKLLSGRRHSADLAFVFTTLIYASVHICSMNFMLVMAALVAGCVWGFVYRMRPSLLPALIISHALWDALVFVLLPIG